MDLPPFWQAHILTHPGAFVTPTLFSWHVQIYHDTTAPDRSLRYFFTQTIQFSPRLRAYLQQSWGEITYHRGWHQQLPIPFLLRSKVWIDLENNYPVPRYSNSSHMHTFNMIGTRNYPAPITRIGTNNTSPKCLKQKNNNPSHEHCQYHCKNYTLLNFRLSQRIHNYCASNL